MTECKHSQEMLPAFLEGVLSPDEKTLLLEHLATCRECKDALEDLKKVAQLVQGLDEVEPPPWFTQKVMSHVREEAERKKKSLVARLFYPLQVKVPIQALASVLIVVMALYVYRSLEPEMKVVEAPSEVARRDIALPKNEGQQQYDKAGTGTPTPDKTPVLQQRREKATGTIAAAPRFEAANKPEREEASPPASLAAGSVTAEKQEAVADRQAQEMRAAAPSPAQKEPPQAQKASPPVAAQKEAESTLLGGSQGKMKEARDSSFPRGAPEAKLFSLKKAEISGFTLHVNDVAAAADEIKGLLGQLGARSIAAESRDGTMVITAAISAQKVEELFRKLSALGRVEVKGPRPATTEGSVSIRIEVTGKPHTN